MGIEKKILYIVLKFFSIFAFKQKINKRKVVFVSLTEQELTKDFALINDKLKQMDDCELGYMLLFFKKSLLGKFLYFIHCIQQLFVINSSAVVILNDNNYVVSNFKRKEVTVIQVWHACGAVKKFGNQIHREYRISNYDMILSSSNQWSHAFSEAFGVKETQVINTGIPRTDILFDEAALKLKKEQMLQKYPILKDHYVYLYAPTFRGNIIKGFSYEPLDVNKLLRTLPEDVIFIYKMHPQLTDISLGMNDRAINMSKEELYDLFTVSDCLISDYSSVIFDYAILLKKMIAYVPDLDEYRHELGLNMNFEKEFCGDICLDENQLARSMKARAYDKKDIERFRNTYFDYRDGKSLERVVDKITALLKDTHEQ